MEVGIELPLALALYSARTGKPLFNQLASAGELSLAGEVRHIGHLEKRIFTAGKMGFKRFLGPTAQEYQMISGTPDRLYTSCKNIREAVKMPFTDSTSRG